MKVKYDGLKVCIDCQLLISNGEINDGTDTAEKVSARMFSKWGSDLINMHLSRDPDCGNMINGQHDDFCICGDYGFSQSSCDGCGDDYHGDRHYAVVLGKGNK